ncbi:DUF1048 domain-containing protein [Enterococcus durans]|uniref:DUF1048 domain-containing protein n=1 Tax=Enterococcus durans TaxID=53345 RepID=A0A5N0YZF7_9ENTE|nr:MULTISPECIES: DUF1048 domain-containing protein [Enterococcus]KAA9186993.1 DUF1048 domain-containing protein [Enterococcus durans]KAA9187053.1 DUF1048 domain-containing protein [Enterococcus durans]KAA9192976.1 DUF1048 domain-containing protein [Enterococcus durans]KAA9195065.1 DUF1048 domain-containing protein [Enterococcus durans]KAA9196341.1 DUF1048 domain-containing protein [Enterococcus durans]
MKFYDKITGNDIRRAYQEFDVRSDKLPLDYQIAWKEIQSSLWDYSNFSGRNLVPILDGILGLLEESAMDGISINQIVDGDAKKFSAAVAGVEGVENYRDKWRKQLNESVAEKLKK